MISLPKENLTRCAALESLLLARLRKPSWASDLNGILQRLPQPLRLRPRHFTSLEAVDELIAAVEEVRLLVPIMTAVSDSSSGLPCLSEGQNSPIAQILPDRDEEGG